MDTKKFKVLERAIILGSFSKAGEELGYTQSAITQMMKSLETEIGFPILTKNHQGVQLTPDGQRIMPAIRTLLNSEEALQQQINYINNIESGSLRIGTFLSCSIHWLPKIIRNFRDKHPLIHLELIEAGDDELDKLLMEGKIDIAFSSQHGQSSMVFYPLADDPIVTIVPENHPFYDRSSITLSELTGQPFILSEKTFDHDIHRILQTNHLEPDVVFVSQNGITIIAMVEQGLGISLLPSLILESYTGSVRQIPLNPPQSRKLGILVKSAEGISPAIKAFIQCTKEFLK